VVSFVISACDVANSFTITLSPPTKVFAGAVINRCIQRGGNVVVEEVQLGVPQCAAGSFPPRAALVISCIGIVVPLVLQEIIAQAKAPDATGEPRAKMSRNDAAHVMPHQIVSCIEDQGGEISMDDFDEQSVQQLEASIRDVLGPQKWYERIQGDWGATLLFKVLPLRPALDAMPLAWRDGAEDEAVRVIGLVPPQATSIDMVMRPCFSSFTRFSLPSPEQLQALADWVPRSLAPIVSVLVDRGTPYVKAVEAVQAEYHAAVHDAPHSGIGVNAEHRYVFDTVRDNQNHIKDCQRCLCMLTEMRGVFATGFGLFSVYAYLFERMGANSARSTCALIMLLISHLFVGSVNGHAMAIALMLLGATSIGKTFILDMLRKMIPQWLQDSASSKSNQADMAGPRLCNLPNTLVAGNQRVEVMNELIVPEGTNQALTTFGDAYITRTSAMAPKDGVWPDPLTRIAVWFCKIVVAASNSICGSGATNPAIIQRFTQITGMEIPTTFATIWDDGHAKEEAACAERISQCICAGIDLQNGALNQLTGIVPSFGFMMSAFQSLQDNKSITPRAIATMRSAVPAAWIADRTACLILCGSTISMTDVLIARCIPIPVGFALGLLQPVTGAEIDTGHIDAFGNLAKAAVIPDRFRERSTASAGRSNVAPAGFVTLAGVPQINPRRRDEVLMNAARGVTPDVKTAANAMAVSLAVWPRVDDFGVATDLLIMRPPKTLLTAASEVLRILSEMSDLDTLLMSETRTHFYLPHGFMRWINGQDGPDADPFSALAEKEEVKSGHVSAGRKTHKIVPSPDEKDRHERQMSKMHAHFAALLAIRTSGLAFALLHCGVEYPYVTGSQDYPLDIVMQGYIDAVQPAGPQAAASAAATAVAPATRDFYTGPAPLKNIELCPNAVRPPRMALHFLRHPAIGVPPSLRKLATTMRLPGAIEVPMANNGRFILEPRGNLLKYGDTLMAKHVGPVYDVFVHPNSQLGDALTCFVGGKFNWPLYSYMGTLATMLYCAPELLSTPDVCDRAILRIGQLGDDLPLNWDTVAGKEVEFLMQRPTSTVRIVLLALLLDALDAGTRLSYPAKFVSNMLENEATSVLVPEIIRFITSRIETKRLVSECRPIAEKLIEKSTDPMEYLRGTVARFNDEIVAPLNDAIDGWYADLQRNLNVHYPAAAFDNVRAAATPRDPNKEDFMII